MKKGRPFTLLLDDESLQAARDLAQALGCSRAEALRRAILDQRARRRTRTLHRLFELFEGNDADAEIRRLKAEDF